MSAEPVIPKDDCSWSQGMEWSMVSKAANSQQYRDVLCFLNDATIGIILGTHREKGAHTFWSYALGLPLAGSSILSWKFCHVLHKVLRDGHLNVRVQLPIF